MHTYVGLIKTEIACLSLDATSLDVVKMLVQMNRIMRLQQRSIEFQVIMNHRCPFSYKINFVTIANNYEKINTCMYNWISKECLKEKPKQQQQQKTAKLQTIKTPPLPLDNRISNLCIHFPHILFTYLKKKNVIKKGIFKIRWYLQKLLSGTEEFLLLKADRGLLSPKLVSMAKRNLQILKMRLTGHQRQVMESSVKLLRSSFMMLNSTKTDDKIKTVFDANFDRVIGMLRLSQRRLARDILLDLLKILQIYQQLQSYDRFVSK